MGNRQPRPFAITDDLVLTSLREADALYRAHEPALDGAGEDGVLAKLRQATELYQQFQTRWEREVAGHLEAQARATALQEANDQLAYAVRAERQRLGQERARAARERERAEQLNGLLKGIHRSLFGGNVYDLILKACLSLTGATRGLYLTARDPAEPPRVRAAIDVDGYPQAPPSPFLTALCREVLTKNETIGSGELDRVATLEAAESKEHFQTFLATPVELLDSRNGVIVVADKLSGDFEEDDIATVLHVGEHSAVALGNRERERAIQDALVGLVARLAGAMAAKDPAAGGESDAARHTAQVARRLDLPEDERRVAFYAALLRDVGKIGIADGTLHKPGPLLPAERALLHEHSRVGADLVEVAPVFAAIAEAVRHHHERYDGDGYPDGLRGEDIPRAARIVGAVDAYCAMTERRSFREAYSDGRAREELRRGAGGQFDPAVVEALLWALDAPDEARDDDDDTPSYPPLPGGQE